MGAGRVGAGSVGGHASRRRAHRPTPIIQFAGGSRDRHRPSSTSTARGCRPPAPRPSRSRTPRPRRSSPPIPAGTAEDVDEAVAAAKAAFKTWGQTSKEERGKYIQAIAEGLAARSEEIAQIISDEMGMPIMFANLIQAGLPVGNFAGYVQILDEFPFEETVGNSLVVREPVGVVGAITPWNYPLHQIVNKTAPALAAGNCVVLKPSRGHPARRLHPGRGHRLGRPARRRVQPGHRHRPGGGRGHRQPPRRRHGVVHRLDPGRQAGQRAGRRRRSSASTSSWAASRPTSSSTTPTSTPWCRAA